MRGKRSAALTGVTAFPRSLSPGPGSRWRARAGRRLTSLDSGPLGGTSGPAGESHRSAGTSRARAAGSKRHRAPRERAPTSLRRPAARLLPHAQQRAPAASSRRARSPSHASLVPRGPGGVPLLLHVVQEVIYSLGLVHKTALEVTRARVGEVRLGHVLAGLEPVDLLVAFEGAHVQLAEVHEQRLALGSDGALPDEARPGKTGPVLVVLARAGPLLLAVGHAHAGRHGCSLGARLERWMK
eukprot:CAMPEP_0205998150 /NCGR_PEP_ID=MMETSP1464-20131121/82_1 /ASSEMBLY_ACC=CAM_ASM_001124 /TAXON_ID=119497 /ORGANISM="Exanthemachrysis gayraliae, Strain RCC1523" /LENGTH=240 /DNA_ID=CAMNT_0053371289 /DNA_START=90 /DNA_END=809 /DNA_ORIENTATION=-